jgi:hypothetical protein
LQNISIYNYILIEQSYNWAQRIAKTHLGAGIVAQGAEYLSSKCKAFSSNPSSPKKITPKQQQKPTKQKST